VNARWLAGHLNVNTFLDLQRRVDRSGIARQRVFHQLPHIGPTMRRHALRQCCLLASTQCCSIFGLFSPPVGGDTFAGLRTSSMVAPQFMLKFVDPGGCTWCHGVWWWYQQLPYVEVTLMPVREQPPNAPISLDQAFVCGSIGRHSTS
jgi:hypothetical protein